ncbi:hypothetical protein D3C85_1456550 [compost metagenome]
MLLQLQVAPLLISIDLTLMLLAHSIEAAESIQQRWQGFDHVVDHALRHRLRLLQPRLNEFAHLASRVISGETDTQLSVLLAPRTSDVLATQRSKRFLVHHHLGVEPIQMKHLAAGLLNERRNRLDTRTTRCEDKRLEQRVHPSPRLTFD